MSPRAACRLQQLGFDRVYDYVGGISDWKGAGLSTEGTAQPSPRVIDAMRTDVPTCRLDEEMAVIGPRVADSGWDVCVVLDCDGLAIGRIRGAGLDAEPDQPASEVMEPGPSTVRADTQLQSLVDRMHKRNAPNVIVATPQGELLGALLRDEADRLLAGDAPELIWQDCDCCPGRWAEATTAVAQRS